MDGPNARVQPNIGSLPGFNDTIQKFPSVNTSRDGQLHAQPDDVLEATYGMTQNRLGTPNVRTVLQPQQRRLPVGSGRARSRAARWRMTLPVPDAVIIDPRYYEYKALRPSACRSSRATG